MDPRIATKDAEDQYHWLCRIIEQKITDNVAKQKLIDIVAEAPLFLWSDEKQKCVLEYYDKRNIGVFKPMKLPVIMSARDCCTVLLKQQPLSETTMRFESYLVATITEPSPLLVGVLGYLDLEILNLEDCEENNFKVDFTAPAIAMFRREGNKVIEYDKTDALGKALNSPSGYAFKKLYAEACTSHILRSVEKYHYTQKPRTIVIKQIAKKPAKKQVKAKSIPRSHMREIHLVLDPDQVMEIKREAEAKGTHASPCPHVRREHARTYRHPRYKNVRGQTLPVKESHVSFKEGEEIKTARRIYHVVSVGKEEDAET